VGDTRCRRADRPPTKEDPKNATATQTLILGDSIVARFLRHGDIVLVDGVQVRIISRPTDFDGLVSYWGVYGTEEDARPVTFDRDAFVALVTVI
jgi:hypothetical protein